MLSTFHYHILSYHIISFHSLFFFFLFFFFFFFLFSSFSLSVCFLLPPPSPLLQKIRYFESYLDTYFAHSLANFYLLSVFTYRLEFCCLWFLDYLFFRLENCSWVCEYTYLLFFLDGTDLFFLERRMRGEGGAGSRGERFLLLLLFFFHCSIFRTQVFFSALLLF